MLLNEKLQLSKNPIHFIKEGSFLRLYNESLYIALIHFNFHFRSTTKFFKNIDQFAVYGGFPQHSITKYFPRAVATEYGYYLAGRYDLSGYEQWFKERKQEVPLIKQEEFKSLTQEQLLFLSSWQKDKFARAIDSAFIQELKDNFID